MFLQIFNFKQLSAPAYSRSGKKLKLYFKWEFTNRILNEYNSSRPGAQSKLSL